MSKRYFKHTSFGGILFDVFNHLIMIILCISILYPLWNMILLSFSTVQESQRLGMQIWNKQWVMDAYKFMFKDDRIITAYAITIFRTVMATTLMIITSLLGAYPLSKKNLKGRSVITIFFIIPMFFSGGLIPYYLNIRQLGLYNSIWVYVIPGMVATFNLLLVRNYIMSLDKGLEESALIDGAGNLTILIKIIAPLSKPILATIALWTAVGNWNAWFDSLIFIRDRNKVVLQLIVQQMIKVVGTSLHDEITHYVHEMSKMGSSAQVYTNNIRAAAVIITIGPIIMAYPFVQKYFVKGIMIGSLKG